MKPMEYASSISKIETEHFGGFTQINLGDATLLTSDTPVFNFLYDDKYQQNRYGVIFDKVFSDSELTEELRTIYRELWSKREVNQGSLVFIDSTIEEVAQQIKEPLPIADLLIIIQIIHIPRTDVVLYLKHYNWRVFC